MPQHIKKEKRKAEAIEVAEKVKLLFMFCGDLIPHLEILKDTEKGAGDRADTVLTMAPIIGAFGQDYEALHFQRTLEARRARALYNLIKTLKETEDERLEFKKKEQEKEKGRAQLAKILGI